MTIPRTPKELREKAAHYRDLSRMVADRQAMDALLDLAAEYEQVASDLEAKSRLGDSGGLREAGK
jgi:hypothetical protein